MYHIDDIVIYGTDGVCQIEDITELRFGKESVEYYVLAPLGKKEDAVYVPTKNEQVLKRMRPVLSKKEAQELLDKVPAAPLPWTENERERSQQYKDILLHGTSEDVLVMTRTLYLHQIEQLEKGKKLHSSDERFLKDAERMLIDELAYVFGITAQEVLPLIIKHKEK